MHAILRIYGLRYVEGDLQGAGYLRVRTALALESKSQHTYLLLVVEKAITSSREF